MTLYNRSLFAELHMKPNSTCLMRNWVSFRWRMWPFGNIVFYRWTESPQPC